MSKQKGWEKVYLQRTEQHDVPKKQGSKVNSHNNNRKSNSNIKEKK